VTTALRAHNASRGTLMGRPILAGRSRLAPRLRPRPGKRSS